MHSRSPESRDNLDAAVDLDEELPPKPDWRCLTVRVVAQHELSGAAMDESRTIPGDIEYREERVQERRKSASSRNLGVENPKPLSGTRVKATVQVKSSGTCCSN